MTPYDEKEIKDIFVFAEKQSMLICKDLKYLTSFILDYYAKSTASIEKRHAQKEVISNILYEILKHIDEIHYESKKRIGL